MKTWIKGGLIGLILGLMVSFLNFSYTGIDTQKGNLILLFLQNAMVYILIGFLFGAIIGFIVGKIRGK